MKLSDAGLALLKSFESCRLTAYLDDGGVATIGYGHTGPEVHLNMNPYTPAQAEAELLYDVQFKAIAPLEHLVNVPLDQNQVDALVSFVFNIGATAFRRSTMLSLLNAGDYANAGREFPKWDHVGGKDSAGLLKRRLAEQTLFYAPV